MKNKFKKSKIIVPALALITATTVASVTGTVAWFTANRAVSVNAGNFVATKVESKLEVTTVGGIGTAASDGNKAITTSTTSGSDTYTNKLTHGSYDAQKIVRNITENSEGSLYVAKVNDDGATIDGFTNLGTENSNKSTTATSTNQNWLARTDSSSKVNIWYGVSWTMKFKLGSASTNTADYLFLDPTASTFTSTETNSTAPGFRIAFMTSEKFFVLGGDNEVTHVDSAQATGTYSQATSYSANAIYYSTTDNSTYTKANISDESEFNKHGYYLKDESDQNKYTLATSYESGKTYYSFDGSTYTSATVGSEADFKKAYLYTNSVNTYATYTLGTNYQVVGTTVAKAADVKSGSESTLTSNVYNLGAVTSTGELEITCVAWYEGSDSNVVDKKNKNEINMSNISASLSFYTRGVIA